jgi:hypothetical protein
MARLRRGKFVENVISGVVAEVRDIGREYVGVRVSIASGENKGRWRYPYWLRKNIRTPHTGGKG